MYILRVVHRVCVHALIHAVVRARALRGVAGERPRAEDDSGSAAVRLSFACQYRKSPGTRVSRARGGRRAGAYLTTRGPGNDKGTGIKRSGRADRSATARARNNDAASGVVPLIYLYNNFMTRAPRERKLRRAFTAVRGGFIHARPPFSGLRRDVNAAARQRSPRPSFDIRGEYTCGRLCHKIYQPLRLKSRKRPWKTAKDLIRSGFETKKYWCDEWTNSTILIKNKNLVLDPNQGVMGHGRCANMMFKWRLQDSPACDCGNDRQTINHIIKECQLRKFNRGIEGIHVITPVAVKWIRELDVHL
ncbi:Hypothetical protein CINCED_3A009600 [Cinara cedri]|uniref:Uncharacterized protein n=1 Tax=Cinara cedri TaxID=506608 RepID=A0A5E4MWS5_9HEMI|nr:Hypothetical protein CINCED_3A009600 [Cinara cedri]